MFATEGLINVRYIRKPCLRSSERRKAGKHFTVTLKFNMSITTERTVSLKKLYKEKFTFKINFYFQN